MKVVANVLEILVDGGYRNFTENEVKSALEKQIPKKPYEETIATEEGYMTKKRSFFYCCPNCFYHLNENQKYCDDCGQALDWSDTE